MSDWRTELHAAYLDDRVSTVLAAKLRSETPTDVCRYCGRMWRRHPTSKLDGHARCIVSEVFQRNLEFMWRTNPRLTVAAIADALGVTKGVVDVWINRIDKIRTDEGRRAS